ncbi:MAG: hypothetical protein ACKOCW_06360 [Planctomycetaceae bacterium]
MDASCTQQASVESYRGWMLLWWLVVRWGEQTVGQLTQDEHGDLGFVHATAWRADPDVPPLTGAA